MYVRHPLSHPSYKCQEAQLLQNKIIMCVCINVLESVLIGSGIARNFARFLCNFVIFFHLKQLPCAFAICRILQFLYSLVIIGVYVNFLF